MKTTLLFVLFFTTILFVNKMNAQNEIATFSIVAADPSTGECGVAVASRFFAVGSVVPWAEAGVGAVATQSFANTSFGWVGLEYMEKGMTPEEAGKKLIAEDDAPKGRQFGIVSADGQSFTYTGQDCIAWAGGRNGINYAVQGNILAGEDVVIAMEKAFWETKGTLADKLYAALVAGDSKGGDSRGKQSAALLVVKEGGGYGGYNDRAIDVRVDDHPEPFKELGRILNIGQMHYYWNEGWTLFSNGKAKDAIPHMKKAVKYSPEYPELIYDFAVIKLAAGDTKGSLESLKKAVNLNPKLKTQAKLDKDLTALKDNEEYKKLVE